MYIVCVYYCKEVNYEDMLRGKINKKYFYIFLFNWENKKGVVLKKGL